MLVVFQGIFLLMECLIPKTFALQDSMNEYQWLIRFQIRLLVKPSSMIRKDQKEGCGSLLMKAKRSHDLLPKARR